MSSEMETSSADKTMDVASAAAAGDKDVLSPVPNRGLPTASANNSPSIPGNKLLPLKNQMVVSGEDKAGDDDDDDDDDDTHDFDFINSKGEGTNYLMLSTSTLAGLLKNSQLAVKTAAENIEKHEPWALIQKKHDEMKKGDMPDTVGNVKAVNLAMVFIKELEKLDTEEKKVAVELVKSAIVYHVDGPDEQTKAEKEKTLITEAWRRVAKRVALESAEKAEQASLKKLKKIEEENADVEHSDVARGKRKRLQ